MWVTCDLLCWQIDSLSVEDPKHYPLSIAKPSPALDGVLQTGRVFVRSSGSGTSGDESSSGTNLSPPVFLRMLCFAKHSALLSSRLESVLQRRIVEVIRSLRANGGMAMFKSVTDTFRNLELCVVGRLDTRSRCPCADGFAFGCSNAICGAL